MNTKIMDQWMAYSTGVMQPVARFNEVTAQALERMGRKQIDVARDYLDVSTRQMQLLGNTKDPQSFLAEEQRLVAEFGEKLIVHAQEFLRIATETQQAVVDWAQESVRRAAPEKKAA